jgi:hypothetical protein
VGYFYSSVATTQQDYSRSFRGDQSL